MAQETEILTTDFCEKCGADVRRDSLYCYNCGGSLEKENTASEPASIQDPEINVVSTNGSTDDVAVIKEGPGLPSAASIRKQKAFRRKPVEIKWEPVDESSDRTLLVVSIAFFGFAMLVVAIALYFK